MASTKKTTRGKRNTINSANTTMDERMISFSYLRDERAHQLLSLPELSSPSPPTLDYYSPERNRSFTENSITVSGALLPTPRKPTGRKPEKLWSHDVEMAEMGVRTRTRSSSTYTPMKTLTSMEDDQKFFNFLSAQPKKTYSRVARGKRCHMETKSVLNEEITSAPIPLDLSLSTEAVVANNSDVKGGNNINLPPVKRARRRFVLPKRSVSKRRCAPPSKSVGISLETIPEETQSEIEYSLKTQIINEDKINLGVPDCDFGKNLCNKGAQTTSVPSVSNMNEVGMTPRATRKKRINTRTLNEQAALEVVVSQKSVNDQCVSEQPSIEMVAGQIAVSSQSISKSASEEIAIKARSSAIKPVKSSANNAEKTKTTKPMSSNDTDSSSLIEALLDIGMNDTPPENRLIKRKKFPHTRSTLDLVNLLKDAYAEKNKAGKNEFDWSTINDICFTHEVMHHWIERKIQICHAIPEEYNLLIRLLQLPGYHMTLEIEMSRIRLNTYLTQHLNTYQLFDMVILKLKHEFELLKRRLDGVLGIIYQPCQVIDYK